MLFCSWDPAAELDFYVPGGGGGGGGGGVWFVLEGGGGKEGGWGFKYVVGKVFPINHPK